MLPPVRPPSASFLVQLFVIPGVIVLVMVLMWMLITWLPQMGNDVASNLKAIEGSGANRWQAAVNLANLLRNDSSGALKRDRETAARLSAKLDEELTAQRTGADAALFRVYLATALGEFYVDTPLPVLVRTIESEESTEVKPSLRVAATRAVAVLSDNLERETGKPITDPKAIAAVIEASRADESLLRRRRHLLWARSAAMPHKSDCGFSWTTSLIPTHATMPPRRCARRAGRCRSPFGAVGNPTAAGDHRR